MNASRAVTFSVGLWCLGTASLLLNPGALTSSDLWSFALIAATGNAMVVVGFLACWGWIRKSAAVPSAGAALVTFYLLCMVGLVIWSVLAAAKEPWVWEAAGLWVMVLCPVSAAVLRGLLFESVLLTVGLCAGVGALFYFFVGRAVERFVLRAEPAGASPSIPTRRARRSSSSTR